MSTPLVEADLHLFVDGVKHYLQLISQTAPEVTSAFLGDDEVTGHEFNGSITFSGGYSGSLLVSMARGMLREILVLQHESMISDEKLLDAVGEVANTLAGNARKVFGNELEISVPTTDKGIKGISGKPRKRPYIITFDWNGHKGLVCVDMERSD